MEYAIAVIILLGILIFIHEFGHFYVAKLCGMKVEIFSIGMGKKILNFKRGETEYALSIFPFGGYVKILGQDPREEISPEEQHRSFSEKPLWQRTAVVLAGPLCNAILAVFVFALMYIAGIAAPAPVLNKVSTDSPAALAGFQDKDWIQEIQYPNGTKKEIKELSELSDALKGYESQELIFKVKRGTENQEIKFAPRLGEVRDFSSGILRNQAHIPGIIYQKNAALVYSPKNSWLSKQGLPNYYFVEKLSYKDASGKEIHEDIADFEDFESKWKNLLNTQNAETSLTLQFKGFKLGKEGLDKESTKKTLSWTSENLPPNTLSETGILSTELIISQVLESTPAAKLGLKAGDRITLLNGSKIKSFEYFRKNLQELSQKNAPMELTWLRDNREMSAPIETHKVEVKDPVTQVKKKRFQIGVAFLALKAPFEMTSVKASNPLEAMAMGWTKTVTVTRTILSSFKDLITGKVSVNAMGGPIMIGKIAGDSFKSGLSPFLKMMAFISLNLFIFNLLPFPVLDGGHLLLFSVEAITRRKLPIKLVEIWTMAGFVLLMSLVVLVTFNDVARLVMN